MSAYSTILQIAAETACGSSYLATSLTIPNQIILNDLFGHEVSCLCIPHSRSYAPYRQILLAATAMHVLVAGDLLESNPLHLPRIQKCETG